MKIIPYVFKVSLVVIAAAITMQGIPVQAAVNMRPLAHRGVQNEKLEENTMAAFREAAEIGVDVETDLQVTKDLQFVLMHDASMRRTTNCDKLVSEMTLAKIQELCRTKAHDQKVPTLGQLTNLLKRNPKMIANVEVKSATPDVSWYENDNRLVKKMATVVKEADVVNQVYLSEDATIKMLEALRDSAPYAKTAWKPVAEQEFTVRQAREWSVDAVMAPAGRWGTKAQVTTFREAGFKTWGRGANSYSAWREYQALGVGLVLTDQATSRYWKNN